MDVAYTPDAMERGIQAGFHHSPVDGVHSIARVKQVAQETGARILYSHDMDEWGGYRQAPEHYKV
jgi:4-pyridoxolactonase